MSSSRSTAIAGPHLIIASEYPIPIIPPPRRTQSKLPQPPLPGRYGATNGIGIASSSRAPVTNATSRPNAVTPPQGEKDNAGPTAARLSGTSAAGITINGSTTPSSAFTTHPAAYSASSSIAVPEMPPPILDLIDYIMTTLKTNFAKYPPHTIQRLAELILSPRDHYRYLAPYLHAIDRVISATTTINMYPLPLSEPEPEAFAILAAGVAPSAPEDPENSEDQNGLSATGFDLPSGSDLDNFLGSLLTPIPWLRRRTSNDFSEDSTTDDGSSPPSTADGSDTAFSTRDSAAGSERSNGPNAHASRSPSLLHQSPSLASQRLHQHGHTSQHRMEVRTEAIETIEGPNGMGSIETVSVSINGIPSHGAMLAAVQLQQQRGITQGELLRQEQTAGVVPVTQLVRAAAARAATANGMADFRDHYMGRHHDDNDDDDDEEDDEDNEMNDDDNDNDMGADVVDRRPGLLGHAGPSGDRFGSFEKSIAMGGTKLDTESAADAETEKSGKTEASGKAEDAEEVPHARGPQEIGAADMGPQPVSTRTGKREEGGLLIGSAADASRVDMRDIDVEAAVGRKASALPFGLVAAPLVPRSSQGSVQSGSVQSGSVQSGTGKRDFVSEYEAAPAEQRVRSGSPKREAEQPLASDVPVKRRKENCDDGADAEMSGQVASADGVADSTKTADAAAGSGQQLSEKAAGKLPAKADKASATD
ncbi:hypothetical protein SEPCBS57363_005609 [Sporothrix epigloea]|uniref:Protein phosphatase 4 core regulatory subunit R2 n=1 Tax=Sporothrix epigloea TaxID=1892477 RepID=A0ABP0DYS1_9PEZI